MISGISRDTTAAHLARATLEGVAFQIVDLAEAMTQDRGEPLSRLRVDGGAASSDLLMQFQADVLSIDIDTPECLETTALGAAYLAALGAGLLPDVSVISKTHRIQRTFHPLMDKSVRQGHLGKWKAAIERARR
jgi:glycerol kinase